MAGRKPHRALAVLRYIATYKEENDGNSPNTVQIARQFGIAPSNAWLHVQTLQRHGYLHINADGKIIINGEYTPPEIPEP